MQAVKYALLGLLSEEPTHGYDLRAAFEDLLGGSWPLNIGQVYSTLSRLERDGLVSAEVVPQDDLPDRKVYSIIEGGQAELDRWLGEPTEGPLPLRDELFVKILVSSRIAAARSGALIGTQRQRHLQTLAQLSALRADEKLAPTTRLIVDGAMLHVEADLKWLELCEDRLTGRERG